MKESVGSTVHFNIAITFIIIVFTFISSAIIYFKSNKVGNVITSSLEKYEGYNDFAVSEINVKLSSLGYNKYNIICGKSVSDSSAQGNSCNLVSNENGQGKNGYCIYECIDTDANYYYYRIRTNMMINIPIINNLINFPIYTNTNRIFDFSKLYEDDKAEVKP
ncbi:MAG: hypothetical protein Q4E75_03965 [bacterium]|nr:hypothetical protein [bacterium]